MEFKILNKMMSHKDHVSNFFVSSDVNFSRLNRHRDVLPFKQNRVELKQVPKLNTENDLYHLNYYVNASKINSCIRGQEFAYIAAQSPS